MLEDTHDHEVPAPPQPAHYTVVCRHPFGDQFDKEFTNVVSFEPIHGNLHFILHNGTRIAIAISHFDEVSIVPVYAD